MNIQVQGFSSNYHPDVLIALEWFCSGKRVSSTGEEKPISPDKQAQQTFRSLEVSVNGLRASGHRPLIVFIDDCSPCPYNIPFPSDWPLIKLPYQVNQGIGGNENTVQYLSVALGCEWLWRVDSDVELLDDPSPLLPASNDWMCLTINAGFMGYWTSREATEPIVHTAQIGNAVCTPTSSFRRYGYSDPLLRSFNDLDWVYRGWNDKRRSGMMISVRGKTVSSGCGGGGSSSKRVAAARYLVKVSPYLSMTINKHGRPSFKFNKQAALYTRRWAVPPSPWTLWIEDKIKEGWPR